VFEGIIRIIIRTFKKCSVIKIICIILIRRLSRSLLQWAVHTSLRTPRNQLLRGLLGFHLQSRTDVLPASSSTDVKGHREQVCFLTGVSASDMFEESQPKIVHIQQVYPVMPFCQELTTHKVLYTPQMLTACTNSTLGELIILISDKLKKSNCQLSKQTTRSQRNDTIFLIAGGTGYHVGHRNNTSCQKHISLQPAVGMTDRERNDLTVWLLTVRCRLSASVDGGYQRRTARCRQKQKT